MYRNTKIGLREKIFPHSERQDLLFKYSFLCHLQYDKERFFYTEFLKIFYKVFRRLLHRILSILVYRLFDTFSALFCSNSFALVFNKSSEASFTIILDRNFTILHYQIFLRRFLTFLFTQNFTIFYPGLDN